MPLNREVIEQLRQQLGISQEDAGESAGFGEGETARVRWQQVIHHTNDPQLSSVQAVARVLGVKIDAIVSPPQKRKRPSSREGSKG